MRLGELRGAIRKSKGNPFVRVTLAPGTPELSLVLQKNPLYESLETAFPDGKGQETGLTFNPDNGLLSAEVGCVVAAIPTPVPAALASITSTLDEDAELNLLCDERAGGPEVAVDLDDDDILL